MNIKELRTKSWCSQCNKMKPECFTSAKGMYCTLKDHHILPRRLRAITTVDNLAGI